MYTLVLLVLLGQTPDIASDYSWRQVKYQGMVLVVWGKQSKPGYTTWDPNFPENKRRLLLAQKKAKAQVEVQVVADDGTPHQLMETAPGSPARKKYGQHVLVPEAPGRTACCPGCGGPSLSDQGVSTCSKCYFTFTDHFQKTEDDWRNQMKFCPFCRGSVTFSPGQVKCTRCAFRMATNLAGH